MADQNAEDAGSSPAPFAALELRRSLLETEAAARYRWAARLMAGRRVLDMGCGVGTGTAVLLAGGAGEVVGVDSAQAVVEAARASAKPGLRFDRADLRDLPYLDDSFDGVFCFGLTEEGETLDAILSEAARVLGRDGVAGASLALGNPAARDFEALLGKHWLHVRLLRQGQWIGSGVTNDVRPPSESDPGAVGLASASELADSEPGPPAVSGVADVTAWLAHDERQQRVIDEQRARIAVLTAMQAERGQLRGRLIEAEKQGSRAIQLDAELEEVTWERDDLRRRFEATAESLRMTLASPSWRITRPLRRMKHRLLARGS